MSISGNSNSGTENNLTDRKTPEYLAQLLNDKKALQSFPNVFLHLDKILDEEINKVRGSLFHLNTNIEPLHLPEPCGPTVSLSEKLLVPVREYPDFNFVGRILGPRGMTAKQLEQDTGCKIMVRGKGSMRDRMKEEMNRGKPNWEHLNEDLHVLITVEETRNRADIKLKRAVEEVKKLLIPAADGEDDLKKLQLMELAIMNGTYRDNAFAFIAAPQVQRMITSPVAPVALSSLLRAPITAGAPIILAPRLSTPLNTVTSVGVTSSMIHGAPSSLVSPADGGSIIYQYDPFVQPMFEYSAAYEQNNPGGGITKIRRAVAIREHPYSRPSVL